MMKISEEKNYSLFNFIGLISLLASVVIFAGCSEESSGGGQTSGGGSAVDIKAARNQSVFNLKNIGLAAIMYSNDNNGFLPDNLGVLQHNGYLDNTSKFIADFDRESVPAKYQAEAWKNLSGADQGTLANGFVTFENTTYAFIVPFGVSESTIKVPSDFPLAFEKPWLLPEKSDEIAVLYSDGHVGTVKIPNVSSMNCSRITGKLTENLDDQQLRMAMLERAARIDRRQENRNTVEIAMVKERVPNQGFYRNKINFMSYAYLINGRVEADSCIVFPQPLLTVYSFKKVELQVDEYSRVNVRFYLHENDRSRFARMTRENSGRQFAITAGGKLYTMATIQSEITGGSFEINVPDKAEAQRLVDHFSKLCTEE